jgi:hypothetical protein
MPSDDRPDQISPVAGFKLGIGPLFGSADLSGPGSSAVNLFDCAEDHRHGALD